MVPRLRPLILLAEAPADKKPANDSTGETPDDTGETPDDTAPPADADTGETSASAEDAPPADDGEDDAPADDGDALDGSSDLEQPEAGSDSVADRLKREQLLDEIDRITAQAGALSRSLAFVADRSSDPKSRAMAADAKAIVDEAGRQCSVILINFSDLGYDRVQTVFLTVRERVAAVAEIIKHVIDGDDDFRDSDSDSGKTDRGTDRRLG